MIISRPWAALKPGLRCGSSRKQANATEPSILSKHIFRAALALAALVPAAVAIAPVDQASAAQAKPVQVGGPAGSAVVGRRLAYVQTRDHYSIRADDIGAPTAGVIRIYYRCDSRPASLITGLQRPFDERITCDGRVHVYGKTFQVNQGQLFDVSIEQYNSGSLAFDVRETSYQPRSS